VVVGLFDGLWLRKILRKTRRLLFRMPVRPTSLKTPIQPWTYAGMWPEVIEAALRQLRVMGLGQVYRTAYGTAKSNIKPFLRNNTKSFLMHQDAFLKLFMAEVDAYDRPPGQASGLNASWSRLSTITRNRRCRRCRRNHRVLSVCSSAVSIRTCTSSDAGRRQVDNYRRRISIHRREH